MRRLLRHLLERELSCRVRVAENGVGGVEAAGAERPDLILFDVGLPVMDGEQMLHALRSDPRTADLPCVAISARGETALIQRLIALGIVDYLLKPIHLATATRRLRVVLDALPWGAAPGP